MIRSIEYIFFYICLFMIFIIICKGIEVFIYHKRKSKNDKFNSELIKIIDNNFNDNSIIKAKMYCQQNNKLFESETTQLLLNKIQRWKKQKLK